MSKTARILALAGSTRTESYNKKILAVAVEGARKAGAEVTVADLRELSMPLYDGDLEEAEGVPAAAQELRRMFVAADGLLIASPEYNGSLSAVLKNAIDWVSRPAKGDDGPGPFKGKTAALVAASPGGLGGIRGLAHLRQILGDMGVLILPGQRGFAQAHELFDDKGNLVDGDKAKALAEIGANLARFLAKNA